MGNTLEQKVIFREILGKSSTFSNHICEIFLKKINVHILEMEDVLFHHNSAVMMPENPAGLSSQDGTEDDATDPIDETIRAGQEEVSGVKALALVFRQFEFDPTNKIVIAGHTDTSGEAKYNFELSDLRAQSVLFLLTGEREKWAENSYKKQKVEDYQQILKYFFESRAWPCDPGDIDDDWGTNTREATESFIQHYNTEYADKQNPPTSHLSEHLIAEIQRDAAKRWPNELWEAVFDLYSEDLADILREDRAGLDSRRQSLREDKTRWVDAEKKFVGCGESFPIDDSEKSNYRSQSNRRVVILFFDKDEAPVLDCPADINKVHKEKDCPIWHGYHFLPLYIDQLDLHAVVYHLSFQFFNRIENAWTGVPAGLAIKAFENGTVELPTMSKWKDGVYFVKVQFKTPPDDGTHKSLHFEFKTVNKWVYTKKKGTPPVIKSMTPKDIQDLSWDKRQLYYDLPSEWSSRNYWTRYDGNFNQGDRFEKVFNNIKKIKPVGNAETESDKPLVFSLDDIVLVNEHRHQNIRDLDNNGSPIAGGLNDDSRYTLFHIDYTTMETAGGASKNFRRLTIHNPDSQQPFYTSGPFKINLITDVPGNTRLIYFCNNFYDIYDKRSVLAAGGCDLSKDQVLGARLAVPNDPDLHAREAISARNATHRGLGIAYTDRNQQVGNYEIHYLHNCGDLDNFPLSCLLLYWNCRLFRANHRLDHPATSVPQARPIDVTNHRRFGMINAMNRLNRDYVIVRKNAAEDLYIRGFHFMEAKPANNGGPEKNRCNIVADRLPNGTSPGAHMMHDTSQLRQRDAHSDPNYFSGGPVSLPPPLPPPIPPPPPPPHGTDPNNMKTDVDGRTYWVLTNHHEFGHATGSLDDYRYSLKVGDESYTSIPSFSQPYTAPGGPYSTDILARMNENRAPRMRNFWKYVSWVNNETGGRLKKWLSGNEYQLKWDFHDSSGANQTIYLDLTNARYSDTSKPAYQRLNFTIGSNGKMDLLLYKTGGETSHTLHSGHVFDGILVVRLLFLVDFSRSFWDWLSGRAWDLRRKRTWIVRKIMNPLQRLNRYYLEGPAGNDFAKTLLLFRPFFWIGSSPPLTQHFEIDINYSGSEFEPDGDEIEVGNSVNSWQMCRYYLGKTGAGAFVENDFRDISSWMVTQTGAAAGSFSVKRL